MTLPTTTAGRIVYALKPASWPKLLVPALLGQALAVATDQHLSVAGAVFGALFVLFDLAAIVLLNDWADREVDAIKRRLFPRDCSPKTIPDAILPAHQVLLGGVASACLAVGSALTAAWWLGRPGAALGGVVAVGIFFAYSLPLRLNYRGGGELLEMLGVGFALPWLEAHLQDGRWASPAMLVLVGFLPLCLASAIASGLSDEVSDRRGGKRTVASVLGNRLARRLVEGAVLAGLVAWALTALVMPRVLPLWIAAPAIVVGGVSFFRLRSESPLATTGAFAPQARYKAHLHAAIWRAATLVAVLLAARGLGAFAVLEGFW